MGVGYQGGPDWAKAVTALGTICWAFISPILADGITSPDAGPTWTLAGACAIFLSALAWAVRSLVVWGRDGVTIFYSEIVRPMKQAHLELVEAVKDARERDSQSLQQLAADVHQFKQTVKCRHESE
jgi:hypothetical protein